MRVLRYSLLLLTFMLPAYAEPHPRHQHHRVTHRIPVTVFTSTGSLQRQNAEVDRMGLKRIQDDEELAALVKSHDLVALPLGKNLKVDPRLPANRRYCRQWTAQFLTDLSDEFHERFHAPLQVNSAVRTVDFQRRLIKHNGNAAPFEGERASSHLAGLTVDIERRRLTRAQVKWLEVRLLALQTRGMVEVAEEFHQLCFHVMVSGRYPVRPVLVVKNISEK